MSRYDPRIGLCLLAFALGALPAWATTSAEEYTELNATARVHARFVETRMSEMEAQIAALQQQLHGQLTGCYECQAGCDASFHENCAPCCCSPHAGWSVFADWLYLRVSRDGLDFAALNDPGPTTEILGPTELFRAEPDYESGLRIGANYVTCCGWGLGIAYTAFDTSAEASLFDPTGTAGATRIHPDAVDVGDGDIQRANTRYDFELDVIDVDFGYWVDLNCCAAFHFFGGFRMAYIDQRMNTRYENGGPTDTVFVRETNDMDAYGLTVGAAGRWNVCRNLSLFGRARAGLMAGSFRRSNFERDSDDAADDLVNVDATSRDRHVVSSLEVTGGLASTVYASCGTSLTVEAGYELQSWMNMADFIQFHDDVMEASHSRNQSSIGLDGFYLRLVGAF